MWFFMHLVLPLIAQAAPASAARAPSFSGIFFWSGNAAGGIDWVGSCLIWFLIALSIFNVGLIIRLWLDHASPMLATPGLVEQIKALILNARFREAIEATEADTSDLGAMLHAALIAAPQGTESMLHALDTASDEAFAARVRTLERLNVLGQVSPMIGLFGTVYGMIVAFQTIASAGGTADPVMLAGGIGTALVTTFWGLLIAIPALSAYATLRSRIEATLVELERSGEDLLRLFAAKQSDTSAPHV